MTPEEFYNEIGGDYSEVIRRIPLPNKIPRFIKMFLEDKNYQELKVAIEDENVDNAFKAAHNLKGVSANLALKNLSEQASAITEALRNGDMAEAKKIMPSVTESYEKINTLAGELA